MPHCYIHIGNRECTIKCIHAREPGFYIYGSHRARRVNIASRLNSVSNLQLYCWTLVIRGESCMQFKVEERIAVFSVTMIKLR